MKVGFVAILGRSNVGKSTMLNALLSKRVSIVSYRAQTTRDAVLGILNEKDRQIVFVDTPGIFEGKEELDRHMRKAAYDASKGVEAILYLIDASIPSLEEDIKIIKGLRSEAPLILVLNKIDLVKIEEGEKKKAELRANFPKSQLIEASFLTNFGLKEVKEAISPYLVEGHPYFGEDTITDKDKAYQAKEAIRAKMLHFLKQEIPHQSAVRVVSLEKGKGGYAIKAEIILDKESHKPIVIGKKGDMIKKISMSARHDLESLWKERVLNLTVEVRVVPGWRNDQRRLIELGYAD